MEQADGPLRWTRAMDYPCGPRLTFKHEFNQRSKHTFGNVVSFYYQWYGLLIFYTCLLFFFNSIPIEYNGFVWVCFGLVKESTYFRGTEVWSK